MTHNPSPQEHPIQREIIAFIIDRQARRLSPRTIAFYQFELDRFETYLATQSILVVEQISSEAIRLYIIYLEKTRNAGGQHAAFRTIKAFLNWYAVELDDPTWKNPIRKITPPKVSKEPLPGISIDQIKALLVTCRKSTLDQRDRALILFLLDTGLRCSELLSLDYGDINLKTGAVQVRAGKGNKRRTVYLGAHARRELVRYFRQRPALAEADPVWLTQTGTRLTNAGLRQILLRRSHKAGVPEPQIHDFRRAFALESLRNGIDIVTLMHLMGHTTTAVLQRYLKLVESDLKKAHERTSPADTLD